MQFQDQEASTMWSYCGTTLLAPKEALLFSLLFTQKVLEEKAESREDMDGTPLLPCRLGDVGLVVHGAQALRKPDHIRVFCRIRPMNQREVEGDSKPCVALLPDNPHERSSPESRSVLMTCPESPASDQSSYSFDYVFGPESSQDDVYSKVAAPLAQNVVSRGRNALIFAYGQTGAGKTHTILGYPGVPGITVRSIEHIFTQIEKRQHTETSTLHMSVIEIYQEKINDLLHENVATALWRIREHPTEGLYIPDLTTVVVRSAEHSRTLLEDAEMNKNVKATRMSAMSSRGHTMVFLRVDVVNNASQVKRSGKFTLVDLAGSERLRPTAATGAVLRESVSIGASLSGLRNVITAIAMDRKHVPYRDSTLTHLLRDHFMDPRGSVSLICCAGPADCNYDETRSTLVFGNRARKAELKPKPPVKPAVKPAVNQQ